MTPPDVTVPTALVLVMLMLVLTGMVTVAEAVLLEGTGSITVVGGVTLTILTFSPALLPMADSVNTMLPPEGKVSVASSCVDTIVRAVTVAAALLVAILKRVKPDKPEGKASFSLAAVAVLGPKLRTVKVNCVV